MERENCLNTKWQEKKCLDRPGTVGHIFKTKQVLGQNVVAIEVKREEGRGVELISHPASGGDQSTSLWARDTHW